MSVLLNGLLSVIVPVFNREEFIEGCLQSVLDQDYRPIELIVIDDGSTDNTRKLCLEFKNKKECCDFSVKYVYQKNAGAQAARNLGLTIAKGHYINFLDSDDRKVNNIYSRSIAIMRPSSVEMVVSSSQDDQNLIYVARCDFFSRRVLVSRFDWTISAPVYKRKLIDKIGCWNVALANTQDWEYQVRVKMENPKIFKIDDVGTIILTRHPGRIGVSKFNAKYNLNKRIAYLSCLKKLNCFSLYFFPTFLHLLYLIFLAYKEMYRNRNETGLINDE